MTQIILGSSKTGPRPVTKVVSPVTL